MEVSVSGYYAWRQRLTKPPGLKRKKLADLIKACYWENRKRYGTRANQSRISQSRSQSWTLCDSEIDDGTRLKGNAAEEFSVEND